MRIIARRTLREFWEQHPESEQPLKAWFDEAAKSSWRSFWDVKAMFPRASAVGNDRIVFRIKGNDYRLIVKINYEFETIFIKFVGTHAAYDKVDAATVNDY
ncbi:MAG: type II toxin-antitoxin system HigB family toxin [Saprospiraceae bacterium]